LPTSVSVPATKYTWRLGRTAASDIIHLNKKTA
jgi:hypothetical protein